MTESREKHRKLESYFDVGTADDDQVMLVRLEDRDAVKVIGKTQQRPQQ